jgi:hypothetical protein
MDFLNKFLRGEFKLFVSFWLIAFPALTILKLVLYVGNSTPGAPFAVTWGGVYAILALIAAVGIWNSATKYQGFAAWKYIAKLNCITAAIFSGFIFFTLIEKGISQNKNLVVDFYYHVDSKNCDSPYSDKPELTIEFIYNENNKLIFTKAKDPNTERLELRKLNNCEVVDSKNWYCGGEYLSGGTKNPKYQVVDGKFSYEVGVAPWGLECLPKTIMK